MFKLYKFLSTILNNHVINKLNDEIKELNKKAEFSKKDFDGKFSILEKETNKIIFNLEKEVYSLEEKLKQTTQQRATRNKSDRPSRDDWQKIISVGDFKIGQLGSKKYVLDELLNPISDGFHKIDTIGKFGKKGSLVYKLDDNFNTISKGYHSINVNNMIAETGATKYKLDKNFNIISSC
jgi:hypothetical protein